MATAKGMKGSFQRCEVFTPQLLGRECSTRALAKGDFSRPRFFSSSFLPKIPPFAFWFFLLKIECSFGFFCGLSKSFLVVFAQGKEKALERVSLLVYEEKDVVVYVCGGRRKQHALTPPPPPSLSSSQKQVIVVRQSPRSRVFTKPTASE